MAENELSEASKMEREEAIEAVADIVVPDEESVTEDEAEEFANKIIRRAASLRAVKIDRDVFLRTELKKRCPDADIERALETTLAEAGVPAEVIDEIARSAVDFETKKCAALSFLSGIPGGAALAATVPADLAQYFAHVMRIEQKLAYVYGWQTFLNEDDETVMQLVVLMGVLMGVGSAASSISKFAMNVAQAGVVKTIQRQALTKTTFYPIMKSVLRIIGVNLTKQTFAKTVGKVVPVIGGAVSGGLTYASFKPGAEHLRQYLRALPVSGVSETPEITPDNPKLSSVAEKAQEMAGSIGESAQNAATAVADRTAPARAALAGGIGKLGAAAASAAKATGSRLSSRKKKDRRSDDSSE